MSEPLQVVAIDGPSGSGKSTLAKGLAQALGWRHLNTGAMYRAVTLAFLRAYIDLEDAEQVKDALAELDLRLDEQEHVWLEDEDVSGEIRSGAVESLVSAVSAIPAVRGRLVELQRQEVRHGPLVAEGRDMTSVVFPDARWRYFLDASVQERAARRKGDFDQAGRDEDLGFVEQDLKRRDALDSSRAHSPLKLVEGVEPIDSTALDAEGVLELVLAKVREDLTREDGTREDGA